MFGPEETVSPFMLNPGGMHRHVMHTHIEADIRDLTADAMHSMCDAFNGAESGTLSLQV